MRVSQAIRIASARLTVHAYFQMLFEFYTLRQSSKSSGVFCEFRSGVWGEVQVDK